jgi:hypothetical protein
MFASIPRVVVIGLVANVIGLAVLPTTAGGRVMAGGRVIAHGTNAKGSKIAYASTAAKNAHAFTTQITALPPQIVKVQYSLTCSPTLTFDPSKTSIKSDQFSAKAPVTRALTLPLRNPKFCDVTVYSTLSQRGTETVEIVQK